MRSFAAVVLLFAACVCSVASAQQFDPALYRDMRWRMIGPFRGGRTVAISGVPGQPNVFYMAPNNGGVWKSTDFGDTWSPIFDGQPTGSIGALAVAPSDPNIIYVGSGEGLQRPDLSVGDGIYKSTDGGRTWKHLGLRDGQQITQILVDPKDPNRVFAAVLGHPYGPNAERGVFRSTDGGETWQKVLYKDENTGASDLVFDPRNPQTLYASLWSARRPPWTTSDSLIVPGSGLFKSTDGGFTWQPLTGGLPTAADGLSRIGLAIAPSNPKRIYALVAAAKKGGLYRSDDAGQSWTLLNSEGRVVGRGQDFAEAKVDPRNPDIVYVANTTTYKSTDGGHSFVAFKGAPGGDDYHRIWINPENPQIIFLGADQGATLSVNGGQTWSTWYNQPTAQFYHVITDNKFPYWVYGGQQESGSVGIASRSDYGEITFRDWHTVGTEEYGYVAPDPLNPHIIYGGKASRYNDITHQTQDVSPQIEWRSGEYRFNRTAPLIFSPADPTTLFLGSNVLFKTMDGGHSWQIISPDLTREDPGVPPSLGDFAKNEQRKHRGVIYSIGPSFKDANVIWIGTDDGQIQITRDAGKNWQNITPPELTPWSKVAQLEASHYDTWTAYAAINRLRLDDLHPYIYRTHDGGRTWQKVVTGLPDSPVNTVREDPVRRGLLFAGTETGIHVSFDDGDHWQSLQLNLPATSMRDLVVHGDDVVGGTHGRSFWILDDITPLRELSDQIASSPAHLFKPQVAYRVRRSTNTDTPLPPEIPAGKNPPDGAIIDYYLQSQASGPVTLEVVDGGGKVAFHISSTDKPAPPDPKELNVPMYWIRPPQTLSADTGMHRFVWDLHYPAPAALNREPPISAIPHDTPLEPLGPLALPGDYTVKLSVGGQTFTQALTLKMDPRVTTPPAGLQEQFVLLTSIADDMRRDYDALQQVRALRAQVRKALESSKGKESAERDLRQFDTELAKLLGERSSAEAAPAPRSSMNLTRLNGHFGAVYDAVGAADTAPTTTMHATFKTLHDALAAQLTDWENNVKGTLLPALNRDLQRAGMAPIQLESPVK